MVRRSVPASSRMDGKRMAERMWRNRFGEARASDGEPAGMPDGFRRDRRLRALAGKEPVPGPVDFPPGAQDRQQLRREHHVAVLLSLALRDAQHVRRSKTNPDGETNDVRFVKDSVARAIRTLRAFTNPEPAGRVVPLSPQMIGLRFTAAALVAGVESRVTAHSGRVGLASELTSRGASTTDVMLAGNWRTSRMVAHYSAGATAERGAVARYL